MCTLKMTLMLGSKGGLVACETQPRKTQTLKIPIVILLKIGLGPPGKHIYISTSFALPPKRRKGSAHDSDCCLLYISSYTMDMYEERVFFGMNREIMKHSSMVKTVEGTNPCQFARPPCPLPASRCMGIARTRCRGDM